VQRRSSADPEARVLAEPAAARLLERASQLDAAERSGSAIEDLRAAATEAGISTRAFDAALAELKDTPTPVVPATRRPRIVTRTRAILLGFLLSAGIVAVSRLGMPTTPASGIPMTEEAILLRCLTAVEAAELVRPLLTLRENTIVVRAAQAPRVLTLRVTAEQSRQVKQLLDRYEGAADGCALRPIPAEPSPPAR
jgi:hypothetical protein